jgi:Domain of unknown function (DUF4390)
MGSTTRFSKSGSSPPRSHGSLFFAALTATLVLFVSGVCAQSAPKTATLPAGPIANVLGSKLEITEDGAQLNADFVIQLSPAMIEAVRKGVALHFLVEFELSKARWYWLDEAVVRATRARRVSYAPLTEQYRVTSAGVSQNVASVEELQRILSRVRSWTVADKGRLKPGDRYDAQVRIRLDTSQLPKPFQVNALGNKEWSLASDWQRFTLVAEKP